MAALVLALNDDSTVQFHPLFFRAPQASAEEDMDAEWIVGLEQSNVAIALPAPGILAIQRLQKGCSIAEVRVALHQQYNEDIDLEDLLINLSEVGLVAFIDGISVTRRQSIGQHWLERIPQNAVAWLYSKPILLVLGCLICAGPLLLLLYPSLRPQASVLLWSPSYLLNTITVLFIYPVLLLKHEMGHLLAARAKGLSAELTFGQRLFYLVAVSRIADLWKLKQSERMLIYSAGMASDCLFASICVCVLWLARLHILSLALDISKLLSLLFLSEYLGVVWECQVFMKTDVYHIIADLTDQHDLPEQAHALLMRHWHRISAIFSTPKHQSPGRNIPVAGTSTFWLVISYTALMVIGICGSFIWFFLYLLPATLRAFSGEFSLLLGSFQTRNVLQGLDGAAALISQLTFFLLLGWALLKSYRSRHG